MQDPPRRLLAVPFLSNFFQGRRHSASDPILRLPPGQCGSATKMLSSSSFQVMVAVSSVSCAKRNPPCPERKRNTGRPTAKYTKVGERLRHVIPGHMACSMACGGRACKYENPARWSEQEQAIKGVYSSWVTDNILAMARPSTELLEKYSIIEQFQSHGLKTVINLQRPGEHASCGNPLEQESGFTYLPEAFMEAGIYFYNFGWKDYGVASLTTILDMVKVMTFALQEGKVAIHCHAGLGRTGSYKPGEPVTPNFANLPKEPHRSPQQGTQCQCEAPGGCSPRCDVEDTEMCCSPVGCASSPKAQSSVGPETQASKDEPAVTPHTTVQSELSVEERRILAAKALANLNEFAEKEEVKRKVEMWQKELNSQDGAWERICGEKDPFILCSLMWSWVEQLKEPVITQEDVAMLVDRRADAAEALFLLEKGQHQTVLCVLHCIASLWTIPVHVEDAALAHAIKAFTKVNFDSENGPVVYNTLKKIFKHTLEEKRKMTKDSPKPSVE
ncbi:protein tyrosine phosphatase domain-containing protein 1 isoform X5 [Rhinolophus ferrumequinum]|uniref:protein tyrosine phosphatase domain-containing protein 1 isoform X5 n=1 Tax=Rhinolophus ferrumequinum TaxID=59479 RepID=UPI00140F9860|nr:protein tyrosine phosphatase domain-containing protein 1 isoform X5 [Rhinolophus ferrumequinum]